MNLGHNWSPPIQGTGNNSLSDLSILKAKRTVIHGRTPAPYNDLLVTISKNQPWRQTSNLRHQPNMFKVSVFQPSPRSMCSHHKSKTTKE